jgi:hypothetical protein
VGVLGEGIGLAKHRVNERRLSMVDVGDDGDVSQIAAGGNSHGEFLALSGLCASVLAGPRGEIGAEAAANDRWMQWSWVRKLATVVACPYSLPSVA